MTDVRRHVLSRVVAVILGGLAVLSGCERRPKLPAPPAAPETAHAVLMSVTDDESARQLFKSKRVHCLAPGAVAMSVDFKDQPNRVTWDVPLAFDLTSRRGIRFDFCCTDLAQFRYFSCYFKSGDGWYHGTFSPEENGVWEPMTVSKSACRPEGQPAGWDRIDGIRISGWRAGAGKATCALANVAPVGGDPEVLIVTAAAKDSSVYGGKVEASLSALGVECASVADADLTDALLERARAVVLPYNPTFPSERVELLRGYVQRGGRLLVCYRIPPTVAPLLGLSERGAVRPTDNGGRAIGGFLKVGRGLADQPDFAPQASWMTQTVALDSTAEVVADWADSDGKSLGRPGLVRTPAGLFLGHVWLGGCEGAPLAFMRAVLLDLAPSLRAKVESRAQALAEAQAAREAWLKGRPSKGGEYRAFWCHSAWGLNGKDWDASIRFLKENGFNSILPNLAWAGTAFYRSAVLPTAAEVETRGDALEACLAACRTYGVQCHVWKVCWNMGSYATKAFEQQMVSEDRVQVNAKGEKKSRWLCPSHPANRRLEVEAMVELAKKGPDGIHFDYIRYPDGGHCFCAGCRRRFEARLGHSVTNWPACVTGPAETVGTELKAAWRDFRVANITAVVKAVAERVRTECPGVKISAATYRNAQTDPGEIGQDWSAWCRNGWLDFVCNMDYEDSPALFRSQVAAQKDVIGKAKIYPGIGLSCFRSDGNEAVKLAKQIEAVRSLGLDGFTVFNFDRLAERVLPQLREGVTRED